MGWIWAGSGDYYWRGVSFCSRIRLVQTQCYLIRCFVRCTNNFIISFSYHLFRNRYMKYLYPYECEKKALSTQSELQAAIDGNRREGRRTSYGQFDSQMQGQLQHLVSPQLRGICCKFNNILCDWDEQTQYSGVCPFVLLATGSTITYSRCYVTNCPVIIGPRYLAKSSSTEHTEYGPSI